MPTPTASPTPPAAALPSPIERSYRERLLRADDVCHLTGLGRSTLYAKVKAGHFPNAVQLHGACVAWRESEVDGWIAARPAAALPADAPARKSRTTTAQGAA
ncbi:helix-turn-helix transcriptional regulator [Pseudorhodoferax sp.]|uniref:helix-turn-helix transcriptional regulator n=1 Tax=Pseudorhodoferax sp. TaxID=1993553 RepID=UPI002DD658D5|nr:AlpA family phage regulatory protein [Pseudorhodoferax sp.]